MDAPAQGAGPRKKTGPRRLAVPALAAGYEPEHFLVCPQLVARSSLTRYNGGVPFRIRQFEKADFDTLWRIDQACFDPQLAYSRPEMSFYMRRPGSFTLVAEAEAGILGFIVAEVRRRKSGHIITIDVVAEARRTGVGSAFSMPRRINCCGRARATVALETPVNNEAAIRFYKQKGYFVEKTGFTGYYSDTWMLWS